MSWDDAGPASEPSPAARSLTAELSQLLATSPSPHAFARAGLARVCAASGASGGAVQAAARQGDGAALATFGRWDTSNGDGLQPLVAPLSLVGQLRGWLTLAFPAHTRIDGPRILDALGDALPLLAAGLPAPGAEPAGDGAAARVKDAVAVLAAGTAHELNNPLTGAVGFSQLLLEEGLPDPAPRYLQLIVEQARRCQRVITNLLLCGQEAPSRPEPVDLRALAEEVWASGDLDWHAGHITFTLTGEGAPPAQVDRQLARRALTEIFANAVAAMPDGGALTVQIGVEGLDGDASVVLEATDEGVGIPEAILPRVTEPFFTTREVGQGSGMGLAVVTGIASQHGGGLSVKSARWAGTTVTLRLPVAGRA